MSTRGIVASTQATAMTSRFLSGNGITVAMGVVGTLGLTAVSLSALQGGAFNIACLVLVAFMWLGIAVMFSFGWRRALRGWNRSNRSWGMTNEYVGDLSHLLDESLQALNSWDQDQAQDIMNRANTISLLRLKNIKEGALDDR
jgi:hypothetical protein